jgi:hypothetical protein
MCSSPPLHVHRGRSDSGSACAASASAVGAARSVCGAMSSEPETGTTDPDVVRFAGGSRTSRAKLSCTASETRTPNTRVPTSKASVRTPNRSVRAPITTACFCNTGERRAVPRERSSVPGEQSAAESDRIAAESEQSIVPPRSRLMAIGPREIRLASSSVAALVMQSANLRCAEDGGFWLVSLDQTLNRKSRTSPSFTTYSLPSERTTPFSLAPFHPPFDTKSS